MKHIILKKLFVPIIAGALAFACNMFIMAPMPAIEVQAAGDELIVESMTLSSDKTVTGNLSVLARLDLNGYTLTVNGNLTQEADISLNSGTLNVNGNLRTKNGCMNVQGGILNVGGWYKIQDERLNGGSLEYLDVPGTLAMQNSNGRVNVKGDFVIQSTVITDAFSMNLSAGILTVSGDFYQYNGNVFNFRCFGTHKVILNGAGSQRVHCDSGAARFNNLEIANSDSRVIQWEDKIHIITLLTDLTIQTDTIENESNINLSGNTLTVNGNFTQSADILLNGGTLNITGNLRQLKGTMDVGAGILNIGGWYKIQDERQNGGSLEYLDVPGALKMTDGNGRVNVKGDFVTQSTVVSDGFSRDLSAGIMTIGGNFYQYNGNRSNFWTMGTHEVVLNGTGTQTVYFESEYSTFNILTLTQPKSNYTFSIETCWRELREAQGSEPADEPGDEVHSHEWGSYTTTKAATVLEKGEKTRSCLICGQSDTASIPVLKATIKLNKKKIVLQRKKNFTIKVSGLAKGDRVTAYTSNNKRVATVTKKGVIRAKQKGNAVITVKLLSKKTAKVTVVVS